MKAQGWFPAVAAAIALTSVAAAQKPVFRTGLDVVTFGVAVLDRKNNFITDLVAADFEIYEDGKRQKLEYFAAAGALGEPGSAGAPELHLGIMLDVSGSMDEDLKTARTAAIKFLNALPAAKDYTVVDFDTEVRVAQYDPENFSRLVERVRTRKAEGYTALYDAVGVYVDSAATHQGRKILVLYTDGGDNSSRITFGETLDLLKVSDATIYAIGFLEHAGGSNRGFDLRMQLQQMAEATGGYYINAMSMKEIEAAYDRVRTEIGAQYTIGYVSANTKADGTWRKVEIKVVKPGAGKDLRLRSRKGYFAPYREAGKTVRRPS